MHDIPEEAVQGASEARSLALEVNVDAIVKPLEDLRVVRGLCYWTDVATAIGEIRRSLRSLGPSVCKTCNGHGIIGGMYRVGDGDVDGWEKPCPDCEPSPQAQSSELSRRLEEFLKENEDCFFDCEIQTVKDAIRALSSPDHADAVRERAWYFSAGDTVPEWLEKIEKGNCTLTFGVDVVVTSKDGGYEVRPQGIADNTGPILHVVNQGNVTPEIKGGGNGVAIIGYNRPYDETAEGKIERLKRLLEMARPYVECYDTREHNAEQDAVLTEIDKALSVVVGEPHADTGKVEGDGIERGKFYHHHWQMEKLLDARRDGLVDHSGGEAWRYEYSHKDEHGKYDILYRPVKNTTIPARLPSAPASEGAE